jgi:hypothetical protein
MSFGDVAEIDRWTQTLMECKQLPEADVKKLCEKVSKGLFCFPGIKHYRLILMKSCAWTITQFDSSTQKRLEKF